MMVHPEDLADVFDDDFMGRRDLLIEIRDVFRESIWCLTPEEEQDLIEFCRDLGDFFVTLFVYDMKRVPAAPN